MGEFGQGGVYLKANIPAEKLWTCVSSGGGRLTRACARRVTLGRIAAAHGLFEGGRWCHSDYGHVQTSVTAAACGEGPFRIVRRAAPKQPLTRHP